MPQVSLQMVAISFRDIHSRVPKARPPAKRPRFFSRSAVRAPLNITHGTGSPINPLAIK
jgi:hypothetical protein